MSDDVNAQPRKAKRRRVCTPPPDKDTDQDDGEDLYDQTITRALGSIQAVLEQTEANTQISLEALNNDCEDSEITEQEKSKESHMKTIEPLDVDSPELLDDDSPEMQDVVFIPKSSSEAPSPPPPPLHSSKKTRLGKGVKAAFNKLETARYYALITACEEMQENQQTARASAASSLGQSDNIRIRVRTGTETKRYNMESSTDMCRLRCLISEGSGLLLQRIALFHDDRRLHDDDTVEGLGLTVADTLDCVIVSEEDAEPTAAESVKQFSIKVQGPHGKRDVLLVPINRNEPLEKLMKQFAESKQLDVSKITFQFDGEDVNSGMTAADLDMDDGDCIDASGY